MLLCTGVQCLGAGALAYEVKYSQSYLLLQLLELVLVPVMQQYKILDNSPFIEGYLDGTKQQHELEII